MEKQKDETLLAFAEDLTRAVAQLSKADTTELHCFFTERDEEAEAWEQFDNERWSTYTLKRSEIKE
tara:strand:- start:214 stop:411 length:198 start_codon:yes stop_codon:yes gene_type:complete